MFCLVRPATRSGFGVQNLRRGALHAAVRAEQAAVAGFGAQHLVAAPALAGQECRHGGHHHFPLRSAYRAGQDRNLDGSASHCAVDPRQESVTGAPLNPLWRRGVNHAVHHVRIFSLPLLPWFRPGRGSQSSAWSAIQPKSRYDASRLGKSFRIVKNRIFFSGAASAPVARQQLSR